MKALLGCVLVLVLFASTASAGVTVEAKGCENGTCVVAERGPVANLIHKVLPPYNGVYRCGAVCVPACEPAPVCKPVCEPACCEVKVRCRTGLLTRLKCRLSARRCCR